ncbi:hypothetical protein [Soonwooa sp.]
MHKSEEKDIVRICTKRNCNVTGLDISMQKIQSNYINILALRYYYDHYPKIYKQIENKYLKSKKRNLDLEAQFYYIAHNIRNKHFNTIHNRIKFEQRNYPPNQLQFNF